MPIRLGEPVPMILLDGRITAQRRELERCSRRRSRWLDYLVAVDFYINETTRHANLNPAGRRRPRSSRAYEFGALHLSVRNVAKCLWRAMTRRG